MAGAHLFKVSLSSIKRYATMVPFIVNLGQGRPTCTDDEDCAPPPDQSPLWCKTQPMARPAQQIAVLKRVLYRSAFNCISHHERSEAFYRKKRAEGKGHHQAVIALARRRVDVLWAMLRDGQTSDLQRATFSSGLTNASGCVTSVPSFSYLTSSFHSPPPGPWSRQSTCRCLCPH
jgi:hypothetical protein